jgi:hypothetical protein
MSRPDLADTLPPSPVPSTIPAPPPVGRWERTVYGSPVWIRAGHLRCDSCGGCGLQWLDATFGPETVTCAECSGEGCVRPEGLDRVEDDAVCPCGCRTVIAVIDGINRCERCLVLRVDESGEMEAAQ